MKRFFLLLACLLCLTRTPTVWGSHAFFPQPKCPTGSTDGWDHNNSGAIDLCTGSEDTAAFTANGSDYFANIKDGQSNAPGGKWTTAADSTSNSGTYAKVTDGSGDFTGQVKLVTPSLSNSTWYLFLRVRTNTNARIFCVKTSAFDGSKIDSTNCANVFNGGTASVFTWMPVGAFTSQAMKPTNDTAQRTFPFNGVTRLFLTSQPGIDYDCAYLSTNSSVNPSCPSGGGGAPDYTVLEYSTNTPLPSNLGSDPVWSGANPVSWKGFNSGVVGSPTLKYLWHQGSPARMCYYFTVTLANLTSSTNTDENTGIANDTYLSTKFRVSDLQRVKDANTYNVHFNTITATPTKYDFNYSGAGGSVVTGVLTNVTRASSYSSNVFKSSACWDLPTVTNNQSILFNSVYQEVVTGSALKYEGSLSSLSDQFDPLGWGIGKLSSTAAAVSSDSTAPVVSACSAINVGTTTMDFKCTVTDADDTQFQVQARYCSSGAGCTNAGAGTATGYQTCGASPCTVNLSGLTAGATYQIRMDAKDAAGNLSAAIAEVAQQTNTSTARYLRRTGNDSNDGTANDDAHGWKTFALSLPKLTAGMTLFVNDGTYDGTGGTDNIHANCTAGTSVSGTSSNPITIKAVNERAAFIKSSGVPVPVWIDGCNWWIVYGLHIESGDTTPCPNSPSEAGSVLLFDNTNNNTAQRNLIRFPNRYCNSAHGINFNGGSNGIAIENEVYEVSRHGIKFHNNNNCLARRNYSNPRDYPDLPFPAPRTNNQFTGDDGVTVYPGNNCIFENNIVEDQDRGTTFQVSNVAIPSDSTGNKNYGTISLNSHEGGAEGGVNSLYQDYLAVGGRVGTDQQFELIGTTTTMQQFTGVGSINTYGLRSYNGIAATCSATITDAIEIGTGTSGSYGFNLNTSQCSATWDFVNAVRGWHVNFSPASSGGNLTLTNQNNTDPGAITCYVRAPLTQVGKNGADIGANVLYQYVNGVLGTGHLWDETKAGAQKYQFSGCGATVTGVNDTNATACLGVHTRLHVDTTNCPTQLPY